MAFNYWQKFEENSTYHIYNRAVEEINLFRTSSDYKSFLAKFDKYFGNYVRVYAYCLMPNHFHILVFIKPLDEVLLFLKSEKTNAAIKVQEQKEALNFFLEDQMRRLFSSVALSYNKKYSRRGPLFSEKVKRVQVKTESKLQYLICYVHHNPIHHQYEKTYLAWAFSSYKAYLSKSKTKIHKAGILEWLGGEDVFLKMHEAFKVDLLDQINLD